MMLRVFLSSTVSALLVIASGGRAAAASATAETNITRDGGRSSSDADGVYGRFDGDLDLGVGLGAEVESDVLRGGARLSAHYFAIAGVYATYRHALSSEPDADEKVLSLGIDLRPTFVPRWARNMQQGPAFLDLFIDSISLGLGAFWAEPLKEDFGDVRGFETSLGFGLPMFGDAEGPWLEARGLMRFPDIGERRDSLLISLAWHTFLLTPLSTR